MAQSRQRQRAERRRQALQPRSPWAGRRPYVIIGVIAAVAIAVVIYLVAGRANPPGTSSAAALAPAPNYAGAPTIDDIPCQSTEQVTYHVHAHLAVFVNGQPTDVPEGIGIAPPRQTQSTPDGPFVVAGSCFYWLHTHDLTGVIHIEAPGPRPFTLGQFFDVWQQPLSQGQVGPATGSIIAYVGGQPYTGNPRDIPLNAHTIIQLNIGQDVPPAPFTFPAGL